MIKTLGRIVLFLFSLPAILIQQVRRLFRWVASPRWYLLAFIPCNAGLWWLGLCLWEKPLESRVLRFFLRFLSLACLIFGTILFFAGLWPLAALALPIRLIIWLDRWLYLDRAFYHPAMATKNQIMQNPYDRLALGFILLVLMVLVINQERLPLLVDISDQYYHMAVAQKILERGHIPLWDDWEFAPMGRPHLYPPLLHLLIAFLAKTPGQIEQGFAAYQVFLYPALLFSYWYLFRFLFGPTLALLSLLFMSMEFMFMMGASLGLPASLVNLFWPWLLLAIIKKRTYLATILLGLSYYTHTGIPPLITLGLWIWGLWQREYLKQVVFITVGAMVLATPWLVRYWVFSDWIQSGGAKGYSLESRLSHILWLLILNPIWCLLAFWGWWKCREPNAVVVKSQILGFLPMLLQYGGRFFMHGSPFLAPLIAWNFKGLFEESASRRRVLALCLATLIPLPCISFMGKNDTINPSFLPGITTTHAAMVLLLHREVKDGSEYDKLVNTLCETTQPNDILHLPDLPPHFADYLVVKTGRRVDMGGWGEIARPVMWEAVMKARENPKSGVFIVTDKQKIPQERTIVTHGKYYIGYPTQ